MAKAKAQAQAQAQEQAQAQDNAVVETAVEGHRKRGNSMAKAKAQAQAQAQEQAQAQDNAVVETAEKVNGEVVSTLAVDLAESISGMFGEVSTDKLEKVTGLDKVERPVIKCDYTEKGETKTLEITNLKDIGCIERIKSACVAEKVSGIVIAANFAEIIRNDGYKNYGVSSASKLAVRLGLPLTEDNARQYARVGLVFTELKDGVPKLIDGVPQLPVTSLIYLAKLVKEDNGEYDYTDLVAFMAENNINATTSQARIRQLTSDKKPKAVEEKKEDNTEDAVTINGNSRSSRLTDAIDGLKAIHNYYKDYISTSDGGEDFMTAYGIIEKYLAIESEQRAKDICVEITADKWEK